MNVDQGELHHEVHVVELDDGWRSVVNELRPASDTPRGTIVLGHAMMVDSRTLWRPDRPTLGDVLARRGFRVLLPDLRGHGASTPLAKRGIDWSYDAIVQDVGRYVALARALDPRAPLVLAGHSLFGHAQLAWLGRNPAAPVDAVVSIAVEQWRRRHEPSRRHWWLKRALFWPSARLVRRLGYVPARALRQGSNDEAATMWLQFERWQREDRWCSLDGSLDYDVGLSTIAAPVLHVLSEGDRLYARPRSAVHFTAAVPRRELLVLGRDDAPVSLTKLRPSHMGVVTDPRSAPLWQFLGDWLERRLEAHSDVDALRH